MNMMPASRALEDLVLTDVRGRLEHVAALMAVSWQENQELTLDYSVPFLASCYEYPGALPALALGLSRGDQLVAFKAGFPRRLSVLGQPRDLLLSTFLTVSPPFKRRGLGRFMLVETLRQARCAGYGGSLHFCPDGTPSNAIVLSALETVGAQALPLFDIRYLVRFLKPPTRATSASPADPAVCAGLLSEAAASVAHSLPVARLWNPATAEWQCGGRRGALTEVYETDGRRGLVTGYVADVADAARTSCLFVEDIFWGSLEAPEQDRLVTGLLARASTLANLAVIPILGYADLRAFARAGFRRTPRLVHAYLGLWDAGDCRSIANSPAVYLDVL